MNIKKNRKVINFFWIVGSLILFIRFFVLLKETFFFHDEWTYLYRVITDPVNFLFSSHNGHFMPLFNIIYFLLYKIFRLNYAPYQLILLIFHFLNAYFLYKIVNQLLKNEIAGILSFIFFIVNSIYWEVIFSFSTFPAVLCLFLMELSIYFYLKFKDKSEIRPLLLSGILSFLSSFAWGAGLFFPSIFFFTLILLLVFKEKVKLTEILIYLFAQIISLSIYFLFAGTSSATTLNIRQELNFFLNAVKWLVVSFYTSSPGFNKLFLVLFVSFFAIFAISLNNFSFRKDFVGQLIKNKFILIFSLTAFIYLYGLSAVSRYQIDFQLARSSRYTYIPLFFLVIINAVVFNFLLTKKGKLLKYFLGLYFIFLLLSNGYFWGIYYKSWMDTISMPNEKIFWKIAQSASKNELSKVTIPSTFHDFYGPEIIFQIYRRTYPEKNIPSLDLKK